MSSNLRLPLSDQERKMLRTSKIKINDIPELSVNQLVHILNAKEERAKVLKGLAEFQLIPSIGLKLAEKLVYTLKINSLEELRNRDGAELLDELEQKLGVWTDTCVEDQIRCVIHHANHPGSQKQWFEFTDERKEYRGKEGYPSDRPQKPWYGQGGDAG